MRKWVSPTLDVVGVTDLLETIGGMTYSDEKVGQSHLFIRAYMYTCVCRYRNVYIILGISFNTFCLPFLFLLNI